ncbi:hypothetical protein GGX14DRAFT_394876 [Mycena pura]|uniref:Uncharacterized protein n=1 Tax=Mycena pura TaxID=153505 RepID=A0AAD6YBK4_9AGAR|nr:hypothetical protein GGX14DRAFT_394876 [Mycena pura]
MQLIRLALTTFSFLVLVAAAPDINIFEIKVQAPTSGHSGSSLKHTERCTGYCTDDTCDLDDGCRCYGKFVRKADLLFRSDGAEFYPYRTSASSERSLAVLQSESLGMLVMFWH